MGKQKTRLSVLIFGGSNWERKTIAGGTYGIEQQRRLGSELCKPMREHVRDRQIERYKKVVFII